MITFKEYLAEIAIKGKAVKIKKPVTEAELRKLIKTKNVNQECENLDVSGITNMSELFYMLNYGSWIISDINEWDTSNVTTMRSMFYNCKTLTKAPEFDTSKCKNMSQMFAHCYALEEVPDYKTSKVTDMYQMFFRCENLTKGDMSNWDVSKIKDEYKHYNMFVDCPFPDDKKPKFKD